MSKHTPGPWRVIYKYEDMPVGCDGFIVEGVNGVHIIPESNQLLGNEDADLRLMAFAPTLLEFAEEVRRTGDTRLASMAIALIAKATGEQ